MKLVIAEKPSVARDIARVLGTRQRAEGYLSGNGFVVTWAVGHLVHFFEPDDYGGLWAERWSFRQLPMVPKTWRLKTHADTLAQFKIVKRLMNDARIQEIICATDAGREGEHIFRLVYAHAGCRKPFKRLWISSLTEEAIHAGFQALHAGGAFDDLAAAARARAQADWLVGLNLTRAYTVHHGALCPIGRVQTPTLGLIVRRDEQIKKFTKAFFYELVATLQEGFWAKYFAGGQTRIETRAEAERLHARLEPEQTGTVVSVEKKTVRHRPPPLFDLIGLQKEANRRFGLTAATLLELAQKLYETYKLITYPRTESNHLSEDMVSSLPGILQGLDHPLAGEALARLKAGHKLSKAYVDKTKLSDHHGIIPTGKRANLNPALEKVYRLIVERFIGIFLPDHLVEETTVLLAIGDESFRAKGSLVIEPGWKIVAQERASKAEREEAQALPPLQPGQRVSVSALKLVEKETSPPKPFTDATLLTAMKSAGRELADDALAQAMKDSGLGTPATRAAIIEKLIRTRLIERSKKNLLPTAKGIALIQAVAEPLKSPELTGDWERRLKDIEEGKGSGEAFYLSIVAFVSELLAGVRGQARIPALRAETAAGRQRKGRSGSGASGTADASAPPEPARALPRGAAKPPPRGAAAGESPKTLCPSCHLGQIIEGRQAFGCNRFHQGCSFCVPKLAFGKPMTAALVAGLILKGKTPLLAGFIDDSGKKVKARLRLEVGQGLPRLVLDTTARPPRPPATPIGLTCPKCGRGTIIRGRRGFGCDRFRQGCTFVVWSEVMGKRLTEGQIHALISKGRTPMIRGFIDQKGERSSRRLCLNENFETVSEENG